MRRAPTAADRTPGRRFAVGTVLRDVEVTTREVLSANRWMEERDENLCVAAGLAPRGPLART